MTSPDPTVPDEGTPPRTQVLREVAGVLMMLVAIVGLLVLAHDVDPRLAAAGVCLVLGFIGWRLTVAEE